MKNKTLLFLGVALLSFSLFLFPKQSFSSESMYDLDQRQLEGGACLTAYSGYNHNQTFMATYNVLTKVGVKMRYMNGGNVTLTVKDEVTGQTVVSMTQRMGLDEDWIYFDLVDDALGYIIDTDHTHSIWIGTSYYPGTAPCWIYTSADQYIYGVRRQGSTEKTGDFTFVTYGFNLDMGRENPEETIMVVDEDPEEEPEVPTDTGDDSEDTSQPSEDTGTDTGSDTEESNTVEVPDESQDAEDVLVDADDSVQAPVLESVIKNQEVTDINEESDTLEVVDEDVVKITGTATGGDDVSVVIDEKAYTATADEDGNWYVVVSMTDLEDGEYVVKAQSKNDEGKGSEQVSMFVLSKSTSVTTLDTTEDAEETEDTSLWQRLYKGDLWYISALVLLVVLGGLIWLLIFLKKKEKEEPKEKQQVEKK
jgi:hypothetical protein